jgi:hypothetical protein
MSSDNLETKNSTTLRDFKEFMQKGDDFFKIELLRPAKIWYSKALSLNIQTEQVKPKIEECDRLLSFENKVVKILVSIVSAVLLIYFFLIR